MRSRPRIETRGKHRHRRIRHRREWDDDRRICGSRRDSRPALRGKDQRIEPLRLHHLIDAVGRGQEQILPAVRLVAVPICKQVCLVRVVEI